MASSVAQLRQVRQLARRSRRRRRRSSRRLRCCLRRRGVSLQRGGAARRRRHSAPGGSLGCAPHLLGQLAVQVGARRADSRRLQVVQPDLRVRARESDCATIEAADAGLPPQRASWSSADLKSCDTCCSSRMVGWNARSVCPRFLAICALAPCQHADGQARMHPPSRTPQGRASASPFGPNTSRLTMAITNASGAPTPKKEARTSCGRGSLRKVRQRNGIRRGRPPAAGAHHAAPALRARSCAHARPRRQPRAQVLDARQRKPRDGAARCADSGAPARNDARARGRCGPRTRAGASERRRAVHRDAQRTPRGQRQRRHPASRHPPARACRSRLAHPGGRKRQRGEQPAERGRAAF